MNFALVTAVILLPELRVLKIGLAVAMVTALTLWIGGRIIWQRPDTWTLLLAICGLLAVPLVAVARAFGQVDVLAILGIMAGKPGAISLRGFGDPIFIAVFAVTVFVLNTIWLRAALQLRPAIFFVGGFFLLLGNPVSTKVIGALAVPPIPDDLSHRIAFVPDLRLPNTPDIIMIYLEGLERAFADEAAYDAGYTPLTALKATGIDLQAVREVAGTGWSIAGIVASQCGLPSVPNRYFNSNTAMQGTSYLAHHRCLTDILADHGYRNIFVTGGPNDFARQGDFLATHSYHDIIDLPFLETAYGAHDRAKAFTGWVMDDQMVFDAAITRYDAAIHDAAPFFMAVQTFGPHGIQALLSRNCTPDGVAVLGTDLAASAACLVENAMRFHDHVRDQRGDRPTLIVILSDHLNHSADLRAELEIAERANTVLFLPYDMKRVVASPGSFIDREASMMDVFPTLLAYLYDAKPDMRAGLGQSLFGTTATLVERKGVDNLNAALFPNPALTAAIWLQVPD